MQSHCCRTGQDRAELSKRRERKRGREREVERKRERERERKRERERERGKRYRRRGNCLNSTACPVKRYFLPGRNSLKEHNTVQGVELS